MKRWTAALLAPALCAVAPQSLIVGVVHDQYGLPVPGALVKTASLAATTSADGTFALASGEGAVTITCAYCQPLHLRIAEGQPVIAIVRRFDALAQSAPTEHDAIAMPYSSAASIASLRPYAVLNDSVDPIPGARVSLFGLSPVWGGTLVDNGIPDYDIAAGTSAFAAFPQLALERVDVEGPQNAFLYGDNAGSGTFLTNTQSQAGTGGAMLLGGQRAARVAANGSDASAYAGTSSGPLGSATRVDGLWRIPAGENAQIAANAIFSASNAASADGSVLNSAWNAARVAYERSGMQTIHAEAIVDGSGYDGALYDGTGVSAGWSDFQAGAGIQSPGDLHAFGDVALRDSTGFYANPGLRSSIAGSVLQMHADAGLRYAGTQFSASAGFGAFDFTYSGGMGSAASQHEALITPSFSLSYAPSAFWNASISADESFRAPSLLEAYAQPVPATTLLQKQSTVLTQVDYGDLSRIRFGAVAAGGTSNGAGADLAWQVAPDVSVRAWMLHFDNSTESTYATVSSIWATYENPAGFRVDVVDRRDLSNGVPDAHLDAFAALPLSGHIRLIAGTERRALVRSYEAGLRIVP